MVRTMFFAVMIGLLVLGIGCGKKAEDHSSAAPKGTSQTKPKTAVAAAASETGNPSSEKTDAGNTFRIGIMQAKKGEAAKYAPLKAYLAGRGITAELVGFKSYPDAARKFAAGKVDAMFSGSGVAGCMLVKDLAYPVVRPVHKDGWSTYWAVVVAAKDSPAFSGGAEYFKDKEVICCSLASSGEFFARSNFPKIRLLKAGSHGNAVDALGRGMADVAIVKNRVWDSIKDKYPQLAEVGKDAGENPNGTLIVSNRTDKALVSKVRQALLALAGDADARAGAVRDKLKISGYVRTDRADFSHTLALLKKAGVRADFNFSFAE